MGLTINRDTNCANCGEAIGESASFCPACGRQVQAGSLGYGGRGRDGGTFLLLVTANVLRLRRQWALAEARCSEALQRDPQSAEAHSVMGDITRDQGKIREAIEWYKMALDRNPASTADRKKLEALIDQVFAAPPEGMMKKGVVALKRGLSGTAASVSSARPTGALALVLGAVLLAIFLVAVFTILVGPRAAPAPASPAGEAGSGAFVAPRSLPTRWVGPGSEPGVREAGPVVPEVEDLVAGEAALLAELQKQAHLFDPTCEVLGAEIDPREASAYIRISMPRLWSVANMRDSILRMIVTLASSAVAWDERIAKVRVRCELRETGRPAALAVVAEASKSQVEKPPNVAMAELGKPSGPLWWAPEMRE